MLFGFASFAERPFSTVADDNSVTIQVTGNALDISIGTPVVIAGTVVPVDPNRLTLGTGTVTISADANISVTGNATSTSEIASLPYGGTDAADNSGKLRYVRVEYSGGKADGSSENNGFSFYGVGNATSIEFIQMFEGKDDGIEFFGGTVNVSNACVVNAQDDSID